MGRQFFSGASEALDGDASDLAIDALLTGTDNAQATSESRNPEVGMRVFVVDDNEDAAVLMAEALGTKGHVTATSFDAITALKDIPQFAPDVILLDIGLPVIDGYELARQLRQIPELATARLFAVTGYSEESYRKRAMECGFDQHITKPIELEALDSLIRCKAETA